MTDEEYLARYSVKPGVAVSVSRNTRSNVHGHGESGAFNDSKIYTTHETIEQCILLFEDGSETPITLAVADPFFREGGRYAIISSDGKPIQVVKLSDPLYYFIGDARYDDGLPTPLPTALLLLSGIAVIGITFLFGRNMGPSALIFLLLGAVAMVYGFINIFKNDKLSVASNRRHIMRSQAISGQVADLRDNEKGLNVAQAS